MKLQEKLTIAFGSPELAKELIERFEKNDLVGLDEAALASALGNTDMARKIMESADIEAAELANCLSSPELAEELLKLRKPKKAAKKKKKKETEEEKEAKAAAKAAAKAEADAKKAEAAAKKKAEKEAKAAEKKAKAAEKALKTLDADGDGDVDDKDLSMLEKAAKKMKKIVSKD